jgi:hypothetical protein
MFFVPNLARNITLNYVKAEDIPIDNILIVETGEGVMDANSYVTLDEARRYALLRGKDSLFSDDLKAQQDLIKAADFIQLLIFAGNLAYVDQSLAWPRNGVCINSFELADDFIPLEIKKAQIEIALIIANGIDLLPVSTGTFVKKEVVGPIETEYFESEYLKEIKTPSFILTLLSKYFLSARLNVYRV